MDPANLYKLLLMVERDGQFREELSLDQGSTLTANGFKPSATELTTLSRFDWHQPLGDLEIALNQALAEGTATDWGATSAFAANEWGSIIDVELLPHKSAVDLQKWADSVILAIDARAAEYSFERLFIFHSLEQRTHFSLVGAWERQENARNFYELLIDNKIDSVARIGRVRPAFQILARVSAAGAAGAVRNYGLIQSWRLMPGGDGLVFRQNRFDRFNTELGLGKGFSGAILGWTLNDPQQFTVITGYESFEAFTDCNDADAVISYDTKAQLGSQARLISSAVFSVAPWVPPNRPPALPAQASATAPNVGPTAAIPVPAGNPDGSTPVAKE